MRNLVCFFLFSLTAWGATYQSQELSPNFKFDYPESTWEVMPQRVEKNSAQQIDKSMAQQTLVTLQRKLPDEKYHARFHVVTDSLDKFKDTRTSQLIQYQKHTVDFLKSQRFQILSVEPVNLPKVRDIAVEIIANQRDFGLKFRQVLFIHGDKAYILTGTTRTEKFDDYKPELKTIFDSFEFN